MLVLDPMQVILMRLAKANTTESSQTSPNHKNKINNSPFSKMERPGKTPWPIFIVTKALFPESNATLRLGIRLGHRAIEGAKEIGQAVAIAHRCSIEYTGRLHRVVESALDGVFRRSDGIATLEVDWLVLTGGSVEHLNIGYGTDTSTVGDLKL